MCPQRPWAERGSDLRPVHLRPCTLAAPRCSICLSKSPPTLWHPPTPRRVTAGGCCTSTAGGLPARVVNLSACGPACCRWLRLATDSPSTPRPVQPHAQRHGAVRQRHHHVCLHPLPLPQERDRHQGRRGAGEGLGSNGARGLALRCVLLCTWLTTAQHNRRCAWLCPKPPLPATCPLWSSVSATPTVRGRGTGGPLGAWVAGALCLPGSHTLWHLVPPPPSLPIFPAAPTAPLICPLSSQRPPPAPPPRPCPSSAAAACARRCCWRGLWTLFKPGALLLGLGRCLAGAGPCGRGALPAAPAAHSPAPLSPPLHVQADGSVGCCSAGGQRRGPRWLGCWSAPRAVPPSTSTGASHRAAPPAHAADATPATPAPRLPSAAAGRWSRRLRACPSPAGSVGAAVAAAGGRPVRTGSLPAAAAVCGERVRGPGGRDLGSRGGAAAPAGGARGRRRTAGGGGMRRQRPRRNVFCCPAPALLHASLLAANLPRILSSLFSAWA